MVLNSYLILLRPLVRLEGFPLLTLVNLQILYLAFLSKVQEPMIRGAGGLAFHY